MSEAVDEVIGRIQRIVVEALDLEMQPTDLDPDLEFGTLEVIRDGATDGVDSLDLVDVLAAMEDRLEAVLIEDDEFRETLGEMGWKIRALADFLLSRFGAERLSALAGPAN